MRYCGVLYGGFSASKYLYYPLLSRLRAVGIRCVLPHPAPSWDFFGFNSWPSEYTFRNLRAIMRELHSPVVFIGHSLGGYQSLLAAGLYEHRVHRIYLIGTPVWGSPHTEYEYAIKKVFHVEEDLVEEARHNASELSSRVVTIYYRDDPLAPEVSCYVPGAWNYMIDVYGSHLLLPYSKKTHNVIRETL